MLELKLNHVSKRGHWSSSEKKKQHIAHVQKEVLYTRAVAPHKSTIVEQLVQINNSDVPHYGRIRDGKLKRTLKREFKSIMRGIQMLPGWGMNAGKLLTTTSPYSWPSRYLAKHIWPNVFDTDVLNNPHDNALWGVSWWWWICGE